MVRSPKPSIHDILENIERVQTRMVGVNFAELEKNWELRFAIQRAIEIISEASRRLPEDLKKTRPEINWRRAAGIGNVLRHDYQTISDKVIWDVVQEDLASLKIAIEAIAKAIDE
jgi:uncharacterized protein with HEPN domain